MVWMGRWMDGREGGKEDSVDGDGWMDCIWASEWMDK